MESTDVEERHRAVALAVNEEYAKLSKYFIDKRRLAMNTSERGFEGGFGLVRKAMLYQSSRLPAKLAEWAYGPPELVAVKRIKISSLADRDSIKRAFTREVLVCSSLGYHPGICDFIGYYADEEMSEAWMITSWEPNGNVSQFVRSHNLEVPEQLSLVCDTINALTFLHQLDPPICHGDIKSANVVVSASGKARFCDFGLARLYDDSNFQQLESTRRAQGSIRWCAPEVLHDQPRMPSSDIYSWAWLIWEIMTGELPYEETNANYTIIRKIFDGVRPNVEGKSHLTDCLRLWDLMTRCWETDPLKRPTSATCKLVVADFPQCTPTLGVRDGHKRSPELLISLATLASWNGEDSKSIEYFDQAQQIYEESGDLQGVASTLLQQAGILTYFSNFEPGCAAAARARELYKTVNDPHGLADATSSLGSSLLMLFKTEEALSIVREVFDDLQEQLGDDLSIARLMETYGSALASMGETEKAIKTINDALAMYTRLDYRFGIADAYTLLGITYMNLDDWDQAATAYAAACDINRVLGWPENSCYSAALLARRRIEEKRFEEAEGLLLESISIARSRGLRWQLASTVEILGLCYKRQDKFNQAGPAFSEAYTIFLDTLSWDSAEGVAQHVADVKMIEGQWNAALLWLTRCKRTEPHWNADQEEGARLEWKGDAFSALGRWDEAAQHYEATLFYVYKPSEGQPKYHPGGSRAGTWASERKDILKKLSRIPKTLIKCDSLACDFRQILCHRPQCLATAGLKLSIPTALSSTNAFANTKTAKGLDVE